MAVALAASSQPAARPPLQVVTTTEDLAAIARDVGGDRVSVEVIARGYQDPHFIEAKPSFILKLQRADLLIAVGRDLEAGWLPALVTQSRNARIQPGAAGYLDTSLQARILDVPQGQITHAMGDVHPLGNPRYWLDPENGRTIARTIAGALARIRPEDRAYFDERLSQFSTRLEQAMTRWLAAMAPCHGLKVVTYHRSYTNFADRFGLDVIGYVEPRPGIPPSAQHTRALVEEMRRQHVTLLLVEPYFDLKAPMRSLVRPAPASR
jgi:zinc/manganese transport system substrate-binding protein